MIVTPMSSGQAHNVHVRVLVVEDHIALAKRIGQGLFFVCAIATIIFWSKPPQIDSRSTESIQSANDAKLHSQFPMNADRRADNHEVIDVR